MYMYAHSLAYNIHVHNPCKRNAALSYNSCVQVLIKVSKKKKLVPQYKFFKDRQQIIDKITGRLGRQNKPIVLLINRSFI